MQLDEEAEAATAAVTEEAPLAPGTPTGDDAGAPAGDDEEKGMGEPAWPRISISPCGVGSALAAISLGEMAGSAVEATEEAGPMASTLLIVSALCRLARLGVVEIARFGLEAVADTPAERLATPTPS